MTLWQILGLVLACGAIIPGPCSFHPQREWDCSLGDACPERFACAADGYCKSADIACGEDEERCEVPGLTKVGLCVKKDDLATSKTHCGACFQRCLGKGTCEDSVCTGAPADNHCSRARGNFDCKSGAACKDDGDGDDDGTCSEGDAGKGAVLDACESDSDCEGGLCVDDNIAGSRDKVCTRPCDFGCPLGFECNENGAPGGLCSPTGDEVCR